MFVAIGLTISQRSVLYMVENSTSTPQKFYVKWQNENHILQTVQVLDLLVSRGESKVYKGGIPGKRFKTRCQKYCSLVFFSCYSAVYKYCNLVVNLHNDYLQVDDQYNLLYI